MTILEKFENRNEENTDLTKAESIVFELLDEMSGRRGVLDLYSFDEDIQEEMLESWVEIANNKLND